jgi:hypothetical protein
VVGLWVCGTLETSLKALILSKSPKYRKLYSLAYNNWMRVFAYIFIYFFRIIVLDEATASIDLGET